ncbi:phosphate ABC transporter permease subunit PstC [Candidatus Bathyarchaeota archaeon]|nr:phosphate ABC transporter permease subunit PstC [Candidatus Bathyarchaeota archaeon]
MRLGKPNFLCFKDKAEIILFTVASASVLILFLITVFVFEEGVPAFMNMGLSNFLFGQRWAPYYKSFGAFPLLYGSLMIVFGSLVISVPLGIFTALFLAEYVPRWLGDLLKPIIELLAAIPSIVYGFFGFVFLAPRIMEFFDLSVGKTALTASVILSIMTVPTIVSISSEVISSVPKEYRKASFALGATKWQTLKSVVLPTAKPGIVASILLAFGRAIGETVAVLMVCGCVPKIPSPPWNYFESVHTLTAAIALEMGEVPWESLHYHALFGLGAILFTITFIVNTVADFIMKKAPKGAVQI